MCMNFGGPPYGVPIPAEVHAQYSSELKKAWLTFDAWLKKARDEADGGPISRASMPEDVKKAFDLICETPIPGEEVDVTGKDSCYMVTVTADLVD